MVVLMGLVLVFFMIDISVSVCLSGISKFLQTPFSLVNLRKPL